MEWFRWYHGTVNDPKFTIVARTSKQPKCAVLAVWSAILEFTSEKEDRGSLEGFDPEDAAASLDLDTDDVVTICHALSQKKLIDGNLVLNWKKRQPKKEDDTATERKRNQREREKLQAQLVELQRKLEVVTSGHFGSHDVTQCHDRAEQTRAEQSREEEREETAARCTSEGSLKENRDLKGAGKEWPADLMPVDECLFLMKDSMPKLKSSVDHLATLQDICVFYPPDAIREAFDAARAKGARSLNWVMARLRGREGDSEPPPKNPSRPASRSPTRSTRSEPPVPIEVLRENLNELNERFGTTLKP